MVVIGWTFRVTSTTESVQTAEVKCEWFESQFTMVWSGSFTEQLEDVSGTFYRDFDLVQVEPGMFLIQVMVKALAERLL